MVFRMNELFKTVEKLHQLELYEDVSLLAELHLPNEPSKFINGGELEDDQIGFLLCCLANACAELNNSSQALRHFEMALLYLGNVRQHKQRNRYEGVLNNAHIRFKMHKILLQNKQEEEALRCLEAVPRADLSPKVLFAMARLCHQLSKPPSQCTRSLFNKRMDVPNTRIVNYFKAIVKEVPDAIYCHSYLLSIGANKTPVQHSPVLSAQKTMRTSPSSTASSGEQSCEPENFSEAARIWSESKQLQAKKQYLDAAKILDKAPSVLNLRFLLEQARLYRIAGDQLKALACYQQAHLMDSTNAEGMDSFAALLGTHSNSQQTQRELDLLAHKMVHSNPRRAEAFVVYGWAARQSHRIAEAKQFAQRAEQLAQKRGRQRCEALLLKAQLLFDSKRHYKEMESVLSDALHNDCTSSAVYALYIQIFMAQKRFGEAQRMAKTALRFVGQQNYQILFLFAQSLADDPAGGGHAGTEHAILTLEKMMQDRNSISLEPLLLLSRLYDRQHKYEKAIALLNRFKESYGDPRIHRELGDLLSKTNRQKEALGEYGQAMNSNKPDVVAKEKMIALMGGFTTPHTANTGSNSAALENGSNSVSLSNVAANAANAARSSSERTVRVPPPVTRVNRRTAVNHHEQLRRLRGMGTYSATGSPESSMGSMARFRRIATARDGQSGSTSVAGALSPALVPHVLQFDDDNEMNVNNEDDSSGDSSNESQVSLGDNSLEHRPQNNSSSVVEQSRASGNDGAAASADDQSSILRHMVQDIQRYLSGNRSSSATMAGTGGRSDSPANVAADSSNAATGGEGMEGVNRMESVNCVGLAATTTIATTVSIAEFSPLISDEPLMEEAEEDEAESHMSTDNNAAELDEAMPAENADNEMNNE